MTDPRIDWKTFSPAGGEFRVSLEDGHLAGYFGTGREVAEEALKWGAPNHARCYASHPLVGFIDQISVTEPRRGKGTGSRLLAAALRKFKELGVRAVYLRAVPINQDWLVPLLRFYWRFGFDVVPDCTDADDKALTLRATLS